MTRIGLLVLIAVALLLLGVGRTNAQTDAAPVTQSRIEVIFLIDDDARQVTIYTRALFRPLGQAALWVVPLPARPDAIDWLTDVDGAFTLLNDETRARIHAPGGDQHCSLAPQLVYADGYLPYPEIAPAPLLDGVAPVLLPDAESVRALAERSGAALTVPEETLDSLPDGWFAAVTAIGPSGPRESGFWDTHFVDATPVVRAVFTDVDDADLSALLTLPLTWRAAAAEAVLIDHVQPDTLEMIVYTAADVPYALAETPLADIDLKAVPGGYNWLENVLTDPLGPLFFFGALQPGYDLLVTGTLAAERPSFVREYVGAPINDSNRLYPLRDDEDSLRLLAELSTQPVLTRLYALYREGLPDINAHPLVRLMPDPGAAEQRLDYTTAVDPAWFYSCTTRRADDPAREARLPEGRTHIDALYLDIAHPPGWLLTTIAPQSEDSAPIYVLAPADAPPDQLARLEAGAQDGPSVLALQAFRGPYVEGGEFGITPFDPTGAPFTTDVPASGVARLDAVRYFPTALADPFPPDDDLQAEGIRMAIIGPAADLSANAALYRDMLDHMLGYPYLLDETLRYTLFQGDLLQLISIGYPADWVEILLDEQRYIVPRAALGLTADDPIGDTRGLALLDEATPWVRLHHFRTETLEEVQRLLTDSFGLDETALEESLRVPVAFSHAGRSGLIRTQLTDGYRRIYGEFVEVSAPVDDAAAAALVRRIADAIHINGVDPWTDLP